MGEAAASKTTCFVVQIGRRLSKLLCTGGTHVYYHLCWAAILVGVASPPGTVMMDKNVCISEHPQHPTKDNLSCYCHGVGGWAHLFTP